MTKGTIMVDQVNKPGLYVGKRIYDRYQVLESTVVRGSYFVYDHQADDNFRMKDGSTSYFITVAQAEAFISGKCK
jgi:hypothetical protein